jgi:uncharacterized membrane protein
VDPTLSSSGVNGREGHFTTADLADIVGSFMATKRFGTASLLVTGVLLFCVAPSVTFWLYEFALSQPSSPSVIGALAVSMPLLAVVGLVLVGIGAYRLRAAARSVAILLLSVQGAVTLHYAAWRFGAVTPSGGTAAIWMVLLIPLLTASVVTLARSAVKRRDAAWTTTGLILCVAQTGTVAYLYWLVSGV